MREREGSSRESKRGEPLKWEGYSWPGGIRSDACCESRKNYRGVRKTRRLRRKKAIKKFEGNTRRRERGGGGDVAPNYRELRGGISEMKNAKAIFLNTY